MREDNKKHRGKWLLFLAIFAAACLLDRNPKMLENFLESTGLQQYLGENNDQITQDFSAGVSENEENANTITEPTEQLPIDPAISEQGYAYSTLNSEEREIYLRLHEAMVQFSEESDVGTTDAEILQKVYDCVCADHPEIFWVSGYSYNTYSRLGIVTGMDVTPVYTMTAEEASALRMQIDAITDEWLSGITMDDADYDKSKYVFETIIDHTEYVLGAENNQNILSVFLGHQSVCQGYAEATAYLLHKVGLVSSVITGEIPDAGGHAFNLVLLNGEWYYMDTTWGDGSYAVSGAEETRAHTNYLYLNITTEQLEKTHVIKSAFEVPLCTALNDNYYVHEGRYFTYFDRDAVGNKLKESYNNGDEEISVRFAAPEAYNEACAYLLDDAQYYEYIPLERISVMKDDTNFLIIFVI